ncbi:MAG: hypothetical protein ABJF01_16235 [bacterium]
MRARALVLSILPIALAIAPSVVHAQRAVYRDCWDRSTWRGSMSYTCSRDAELAVSERRAAAAARSEARAIASAARTQSRAASVAMRAEARAAVRAWSRVDARAYSGGTRAMERLRDRLDARRYENRSRYYRRW